MKTLLASALVLVSLVACAPAPKEEAPEPASVTGTAPRLPSGFVRTDGKGDVPVTLAGKADCSPMSAAAIAQALASTNATRAASGLPALQASDKAQRAAEKHACDMASRGMMTHTGRDTTGPSPRMKREGYKPRLVAENIAAGRMNLHQTVREWSASPGHKANIVIPGLRDFGVASATGSDGRSQFWVAVYGQPQ